MFRLSERSLAKLEGVHPDLVAIVKDAITISDVDFGVIEGLRTLARQKELYAQGATRTLNSRHISGHAVDLGAYVGGILTWKPKFYKPIAAVMKLAARDRDVPIIWGGDWLTFKDLVHFELDKRKYP